jgi:hypothetical protein
MTSNPTHLAIGFQKCCKCKHVLPLEEFYRPGDKHRSRRKSCNSCAAAAKAVYAEAQAEGLLHCTSCNQKKARSLFFDGDQRRQTCSDCRAKGRKKQFVPKPQRAGLYPGWESLTFGEFSPLDPLVYPFRIVEVAA